MILLYFFNSYLLNITYHGETVSVPDLEGMNVNEVREFLEKRDLGFIIEDSTYSESHKPNVVLTQTPAAGDMVKRNRKIRVTINPLSPPKVKLPYLVDLPFSEALRKIKNTDLKLGKISYKPYIGQNIILEQKINGKTYNAEDQNLIKNGDILVTKGTVVNLLIGDGVGKVDFPVPDLVGLTLDEAELIIKGSELYVGVIKYDFNSSREIGTVLKQTPTPYFGRLKKGVKAGSAMDNRERQMTRAGQVMDLWVAGNPAARPEDAEEEELTEEERRRRDSLNQNINIRNAQDFERYRKKQLGIEDPKEKNQKPDTTKGSKRNNN